MLSSFLFFRFRNESHPSRLPETGSGSFNSLRGDTFINFTWNEPATSGRRRGKNKIRRRVNFEMIRDAVRNGSRDIRGAKVLAPGHAPRRRSMAKGNNRRNTNVFRREGCLPSHGPSRRGSKSVCFLVYLGDGLYRNYKDSAGFGAVIRPFRLFKLKVGNH